MATLDTLTSLYRNVHRLSAGAELPSSAKAQLTLMAQGIDIPRDGQTFGDLWSYASAVHWIQDSAKATTQVAVLSYAFLTDTSLSTAGVDYLVAANGANPNSLNSAYYASLNTENRYINFAVNLVKNGQAKDAFVQEYGANGSAADTFVKAYAKLFGVQKTQSEAQDILNQAVSNGHGGTYTRAEYFAEIGGGGLGARAAMVGWLMASAAEEDKGPYAEAMRAYLTDLGADGQASAKSAFLPAYGNGTGNDLIKLEKFDGLITTGGGHDVIEVGSFAGLHLSNGKVTDIAVIGDFEKGADVVRFTGATGPGQIEQLFFITTATFDDALAAYAGLTAAGANTVFEWNGDTYVFHQNGVTGVDAGDGLIKLAGVTGLTVGKAGQDADLLFAA